MSQIAQLRKRIGELEGDKLQLLQRKRETTESCVSQLHNQVIQLQEMVVQLNLEKELLTLEQATAAAQRSEHIDTQAQLVCHIAQLQGANTELHVAIAALRHHAAQQETVFQESTPQLQEQLEAAKPNCGRPRAAAGGLAG